MGVRIHRGLATLALLGFLGWSLPAQEARKQEQPKRKEPSKAKSSGASMTGCIDQQDGKYVLVDDRSLAPIANLEAEGFPTEGFAKHMGHKVTVRGISNPGNPRPVFRVRSIETVSDTCAPQSKSAGVN